MAEAGAIFAGATGRDGAPKCFTFKSCARHEFRDFKMYTLNFPNGNSQTYNSVSELQNAAHKLGGTAKSVGNKTYVFAASPKRIVL